MLRSRLSSMVAGVALVVATACTSDDSTPLQPSELSKRAECRRSVTRLSHTSPVPRNTSGWEATFRITNLDNTANTANVLCSKTGTITCSPASQPLTLAANANATVVVIYNAGAPSISSLTVASCGGNAGAKVIVQ